MKTFSIAEARNSLPAIVHDVEDGSEVELTRHGHPVAVIMSIRQYEGLAQHRGDFWDALTTFRAGRRDAADWLADADLADLRDPTPGREVTV